MRKIVVSLIVGVLSMLVVGMVSAQDESTCEVPEKLNHVTNLRQRGDLLTWHAPTPYCVWRTDADYAIAEQLGDYKSVAVFYIVERKVAGEWSVVEVFRHQYSDSGMDNWRDPRWTDVDPGETTDYRVGSIWNGALSGRVQRSR